MRLDGYDLANDGSIGAKFIPPGAETEHNDRRRCGCVIAFVEDPSRIGVNSKRRKVIPCYEFSAKFAWKSITSPDAPLPLTCLYRGKRFKLRTRRLQMLIEIVGEDVEVAILTNKP